MILCIRGLKLRNFFAFEVVRTPSRVSIDIDHSLFHKVTFRLVLQGQIAGGRVSYFQGWLLESKLRVICKLFRQRTRSLLMALRKEQKHVQLVIWYFWRWRIFAAFIKLLFANWSLRFALFLNHHIKAFLESVSQLRVGCQLFFRKRVVLSFSLFFILTYFPRRSSGASWHIRSFQLKCLRRLFVIAISYRVASSAKSDWQTHDLLFLLHPFRFFFRL